MLHVMRVGIGSKGHDEPLGGIRPRQENLFFVPIHFAKPSARIAKLSNRFRSLSVGIAKESASIANPSMGFAKCSAHIAKPSMGFAICSARIAKSSVQFRKNSSLEASTLLPIFMLQLKCKFQMHLLFLLIGRKQTS